MTTAELLERFACEAEARGLPEDLAAEVATRLWSAAPARERRAERDRLLVEAAGLRGSQWARAGRLAALVKRVRRQRPTAAAREPDGPEALVAAALAVYNPGGRSDRALSRSQAFRLLTSIRGVEMEAAPVSLSQRKEKSMYRFEAGADRREKFATAAVASIIERAGHARMLEEAHERMPRIVREVPLDPGEFGGASLCEIARASLEVNGFSTTRLHGDALIERALQYRDQGSNTTSDFTTLLETAVNKIFLGRYALTPVTWRAWCGVKSVKDFRTSTFYRPGSFGTLDSVSEAGEIKHKNIPDGTKRTLSPATKGNIIGITRRSLANDDLGAFSDLASALGEGAAYSVEADALALVTANSGLGINYDANPLFHSTRSNIGPTGAMSITTLDGARAVMAKQKDVSQNRYVDMRPAVWLGPVELGGLAKSFNESTADPTDNKSAGVANRIKGIFPGGVVDSATLSASSATRHYLLADPALYPVFAVGFLNGQEAPQVESGKQFGFDGVQIRVILDYGTAALDYRGAVTCAGA